MFNRIISILTVILMVSSCGEQDGFKTTDSGLEYQFVSKGTSGNQPVEGQIVTLNLSMVSEGDSILMQASNMPIQKVEQMWSLKGGIEEAFSMMSEGDSIIVRVKAGDLYQRTWQMPVPPNINEDQLITCVIGMEKIYDADEFQKQQALAQVEEIDANRKQTL